MPGNNKKILRFAIYLALTIGSLIYYHVVNTKNDELLHELFNNTIFGIEGVTTELVYFSDKNNQIGVKIKAWGLPEKATNYKPLLLVFVCSNQYLKNEVLSGKTIILDMSAPDRDTGAHMNMRINKDRCRYDV